MRHVYDYATVCFTRQGTIACFLVIAFVAWLGFHGVLPGQPLPEAKTLKIADARLDKWNFDQAPKIVVCTVPINEKTYPEGVPNRLDLTIKLEEPLRKAWEIWLIDLVEIGADKKNPIKSVQSYLDKGNPFQKREVLNDFRRQGYSYVVEVHLHAFTTVTDAEKESAKKVIMDGSGIVIQDILQR